MKALFVLFLLAGCAADSTIPLGAETSPPPGWIAYCVAHPQRPECN